MTKRIGYSRLDMPPNYYRSGLSQKIIRLAIENFGWLTVTQVTGMLSDQIAPEVKARYAQLHTHIGGVRPVASLEKRMASGVRDLVRSKLRKLVHEGKVEKDGIGKDARYRWASNQNSGSGSNTPRRGHAIKKGTRRRGDKGVRRVAESGA